LTNGFESAFAAAIAFAAVGLVAAIALLGALALTLRLLSRGEARVLEAGARPPAVPVPSDPR
jgi:hypothetical protein